MRVSTFTKLLADNQFALHPLRIPMAALVYPFAISNSVNYQLQNAVFGRRIRETKLESPLFILGHWRSGTTLLHELMSGDLRFTTPSTIQCFGPCLCLLYGPFIEKWLNFIMPKNRPMDNMTVGWSKPQEDEFALCNFGQSSPYLRMAFPNRSFEKNDLLDLASVSEEQREDWLDTLEYFMQMVSLQASKPLILKSPTHTGRIGEIAGRFPDSKFIHISRNPYEIFSSTIRLWQTMDQVQGFQFPKNLDYREYVFDCFERMYAAYDRGVADLPEDRICRTSYEALVADPVGEMRRIYEAVGLDDFESIEQSVQDYADRNKDFKRNKHQLDDETRDEIKRRWKSYFETNGYPLEDASS